MTRTTKLMLGLSLWLAAGVQAYVPYYTTTGLEVSWPNAQTTAVRYSINPADIGSVTTTQTFIQAVNASFNTWQSVATSALTYSYQGPTDAAGGEIDGINCVDFSKDNALFADEGYTEVIGLTVFNYDSAGNMLEADTIFNTADYVFATTQETNLSYVISATGEIKVTGYVNFYNVAVHEIGHFSGLGHSYIDGNLQSIRYDQYGSFLGPYPNLRTMATMFPYELAGSESRTLEEDDKVGLSHLYPTSAFYSTRGILYGTVVSALDPTEPVFGAHVVAVDAAKKETVGVLSQKDGSFILDGLTPGKYRLFAEPISFLETAAPYWQTAELRFPQEFYSDEYTFERAQAFDVVANGLISNIEHTVLVGFSGVDVYEPNDTFLEFSDANPDAERFGLIDVPGDVDIFRFRALRGSLIHVEVLAQRQNTLMKPVLTIYNADEQAVAENSDYYGLNGDAQIDFRVPASGYYFVKVQHENVNEGGEGYYYRLSIIAQEKVVPMLASSDLTPVLSFELTTDKVLPTGDTRQLHLRQITLVLRDVGPPYGDFGIEDLAAITDTITSGISVFNDKGGTTAGVFEYNPNAVKGNDVRIPLDGSPDSAVTVTKGVGQVTVQIRFARGTSATLLPFTAEGKPDFHVVIRTSEDLHLGDDFKVQIPANGLLLTDASGNYFTAYSSPLPKNPSIYTGELLKLTSTSVIDQRIGLASIPTGVIGINAAGDSSEGYYLSKIKFLVLGYSARNYIPFAIDRFRFTDLPDTIVRELGSYGDFSVDQDLKEFFVSADRVQGGGIAVYRDFTQTVQGGEVSGDGTFQPGIDLALPYKTATVEEIPIREVPRDFLDVMVPRLIGANLFTLYESAGYDFSTGLNVRAFEVTLELEMTGNTTIPGTDLERDQTAGDDFFVAVQTSAQTRALDSFMILIPDEGIEIKNNYGLSPSLSIARSSLAYLDPTLGDQSIQPLTVRPEPVVVVNDLTKKQARSRTLPLEGASPVPVLGFSMVDYGMSTHVVPQSQSVDDYGIYFNQGYTWDSLLLNFIPENSFERDDLRELAKQSFYSNNTVFYGHGVGIFVDDDTPIGDLLDNDGDGLIDEELRNGRDDDLDGIVDEEDWGDYDDAGVNGVFDSLDYDNFWPPLASVRNRYVNFTNEAEYATTPVFDNVAEPDGSYQASFEMEAIRINEEALDPYDFINDPWTFSPQFLFIRTGYSPIWYDPTPTVSDFALTNPNNLTPQGFYITLGDDEEDYQALIDIWEDAGRANTLETTYHHVFPIPDEDGGEGFEFLEGDDVFVVLRASGTAEEGDSFRIQIPREAFGFSVYQSPDDNVNVDVDGNPSFPVDLPAEQNLSEVITIGAGGQPPEVTVVSPGAGINYFDTDFAYMVKFSVVDPDSINGKVDIYLDNNALGFDGIKLNSVPLMFTQTKFGFTLNDATVLANLKARFGIVSVQRLTEQDRFYIYIEADDLVTDKVRVYSDGYITIDKDNVEDLAAYLKLDRNGTIYSIGVDQRFDSVPVEEGAAAVDLEVLPEENGVLVLREDGKVYGRKVQGTALGLYEDYWTHSWDLSQMGLIDMPSATSEWPAGVRAVDLEIVPETPGYYILDPFGIVRAYGALRDDFVYPIFGWDIARDMELTSSGEGLYILDGYGEVHILGNSTSTSEMSNYKGVDIFTDLTLTPSENGYYTLTKYGQIYPQGDALALTIAGATDGSTVDLGLVGLEYTPNSEGFLVMAASGEVTPLLNARLGPDFALNPELNNFTDIEVVGLTAGNAEEIIREYFEAYAKEDIDRICALLADDYFDDHYNDCALFTKSLRQIFDYYMIGLPTENPMTIENVEIQVSAGEAIVTADVVISFRYPSFQAMAIGDVLTLSIPYSQTVQMVELGDGRNDQLSVYDLDNPEGIFDPLVPERDRKIFEKTFMKPGVEGPYKLYLKYEGVGQNSAYIFTLADGVNYPYMQPADVRVGYYPPETVFHATDTVQFEFTLARDGNRGFRIQKAPLLQMLPVFDEEANPIGFSFARRGPVADYQFLAGDVDANFLFGPGDFRVTGDEGLSITHSLTGYPGVVNLTAALGITEFDQYRVGDYKDIPSYQFDDTVTAAIDTVYLVITKDQKRYGLVRPVRLSTSADVDGVLVMIFDWQFRDEFVIPK